MSELHDFAAMIVAVRQGEGRRDGEAMMVSDLLDRIFPYAQARRRLGIDVSEDYEALMLRLLAEEGDLARVIPQEAAELARETMLEKLPDLAVLQLLRGATVVLQVDPARVVPLPPPSPAVVLVEGDARWRGRATAAESVIPDAPLAATGTSGQCWSCAAALPAGRSAKFCPQCGADQRPPVCSHCQEPLERGWKHCPECGTRVERPAAPAP